ncbi:cytochrome P450 [Streptomyces murinus]|uniref:cytochrome P450 n=1 Tax=Streptomyces murinus TaxID=33900 RepID=UPI0033D72643
MTAHTSIGIPYAPQPRPLVGHALRLRRDPLRLLQQASRSGDNLVRLRIGSRDMLLICDAQLTWEVLHNDTVYDKGGPLIELVRELVGDGLATCPRTRHRAYRRQLQPVFAPDHAYDYLAKASVGIQHVVSNWRHGQILDIPVEMRRLALHAAVHGLFSAEPTLDLDSIAQDLTTILVGFAQRVARPPLLDHLPTPSNHRYTAALARFRDTVARTVRARRQSHHEAPDDLLAALLSTDTSHGSAPLNDRQILDHAVTFITAPTATVASVMGWALHLVATHPHIAERLAAEAHANLQGNAAGPEHLPQLTFTAQVITEVLRLYPSVWLMTRIATADTYLGGHHLDAGTVLAYSPYLIHRNPDLYPDPHRFDPGRWTSLTPTPRHAYIPYGAGPRQCIAGQSFATNQMIICLASVAQAWNVHPIAAAALPLRSRAAANLTPRGLHLQLTSQSHPMEHTAQLPDRPRPTAQHPRRTWHI